MSIEELIEQQVGIKPGANDLTPMDYLECKTIAEKYASQQVQELKNKLISECDRGISLYSGREDDDFADGHVPAFEAIKKIIQQL